jgi:hypothetical protein
MNISKKKKKKLMVGFGFFFRPLMVVMATLMGFVPFIECCHLLQLFFGRLSFLYGPNLRLSYS